MAMEVGSSSRGEGSRNGGGGDGARGQHVLKKGPWTEAEDAELLEYVRRHGEGNWNVVHKNSGLRRCGKSCRLRWANHLRPNLKRGPLSPEEEEIIIKLHAKFGNKWACIASQLDGRTDNEIKNYWNARLKKRQRTGLPLYPLQTRRPPPPISISPSSSLTSIFSASASSSSSQHNTTTYPNNPLTISPLNYSPYRNTTTTTNNPFSFVSSINNNSISSRYNPSSSFPNATYSSMPFFHQSLSANSLPFNSLNLNTGLSMPATRAPSFDPVSLFDMNTSSTRISTIGSQPLVRAPSTAQTSSGYTGSEGGIIGGASSSTTENDHIEPANSGLLEDLLEQSRTITRLEKLNKDIAREDHELLDQNSLDDFSVGLGHGNPNPEVYLHDCIPTHSDIGMNEKNEILEADMNLLDDDLMRLLECPSPMPIPDWYDDVVATTNYSKWGITIKCRGQRGNNKY